MRRFTFKEKRNSSYAIQKKHQILPKEKNLTITVRRRRTTYACFPMKQRKVVVVNLKTWQHNYDLFSLVMGRLENEGTLSPIVRRHFCTAANRYLFLVLDALIGLLNSLDGS